MFRGRKSNLNLSEEMLHLPTKVLNQEEETEIVNKILEGDENARKTLIMHNLKFVVYILKELDLLDDDLLSVGTFGLIKAANSFNPSKHVKFATYASKCIKNEIFLQLRKNEKFKNDVSMYNLIKNGKNILILDLIDDETAEEPFFNLDSEYEKNFLLQKALKMLTQSEIGVIAQLYGLFGNKRKTQVELSRVLGITQSYISRVESKAIRKLRKFFEDDDY
ncbi:MAG: RNA polymerase sporulation sigma factor SigE [Candidatus Paraimprobicoccus trichonymphae]|uniref:RNA polymerase sigma factor n=1 Tax=Candidatus Paraimprobicoccus trichonymphae TaxID=3033793 RepID=A0AA48I0A4_9FIRM|nr:MAG: RNA polymerase sporulation sigma factor SigE [Candidatus Paraimprobicoccus trichonymphae]